MSKFENMAALVLLILAPALGAASTAPGFSHLTVDEGLPDNSVRAMVQDRHGFLWLGTQNGLVRYDGQHFKAYAPLDTVSGRPQPLQALSMLEDREGDLWIGTFSVGVWRLDPMTGQFEHWGPESPPERRLASGQIEDMAQDLDGTIWLATSDGVLVGVDPASGDLRNLRRQPDAATGTAPPDTAQSCVFLDSRGRLWVASEGHGVAYRPRDSRHWRHFRGGGLPSDLTTEVHEDARGRIWVTTRQGLARFNPTTETFTAFVPVPESPVSHRNYLVSMDHDHRGRLWIGSAAGMVLFDPGTGRFEMLAHDPGQARSLLPGPVLEVHCDASGVIWGGSWLAGLNRVDPEAPSFEVLLPHNSGLNYKGIQTVLEDSRGVLWVGTGDRTGGVSPGGLNSRHPGEQSFRHYRFPPDDAQQPTSIYGLCEDRHGDLWIGTDRGVWILLAGSSSPQRIPGLSTPGAPAQSAAINGIVADLQGRLWLGGHGTGVLIFDPDSGGVLRVTPEGTAANDPLARNVHDFYRDRAGRIWVFYDVYGAAYAEPGQDRLTHCFDPRQGLVSPMGACEDIDGRFWIASFSGLLQVNEHGQVTRTIGSHEGLPNDLIGSLLADLEGRLWLSTPAGLASFDPISSEIRHYDAVDGLPPNALQLAGTRSTDGALYFGGPNGLVSFDPTGFHGSPYVPPVVITRLQVADEVMEPGPDSPLDVSIDQTADLSLPHHRNDLTVSFAALHYARPDRNQYRYRMDGVDEQWRTPEGEPRAYYTNLAPGRYRFRVRGSNGDGVWNEQETVLGIRIRPPWWLSAPAKVVAVLLAAAVMLAVYRQIVQRERMRTALGVKRAEARQLEELNRLRTRFFANVSHEFRTPLTLLRTPLRKLRDQPESGDATLFAMMSRNADRLGQLIDQLLDLSRLEAGRLPVNWRCEDVSRFLQGALGGFANVADSKGIDLVLRLPETAPLTWFDPDILEKVAGNLVTNAIKHTLSPGQIMVTARVLPTTSPWRVPGEGSTNGPALPLRLSVHNTGSYIPPEEHDLIFHRFHQLAGGNEAGGSGLGLALVKELVELMGGTIDLASDPNGGTEFSVELPLFTETPPGVVAPEAGDLVDDSEQDEDDEPDRGALDSPSGRPRLLVVEDDPDLRHYLVRELGALYEVLEAEDGESGLQLALGEIPDLVISDVMMPRRDGFDLCRHIKTNWRTSHIPVILLTAKSGTSSRLLGLEQGADDYLSKPFDIEELLARVANLITMRRQLQQRFAAMSRDVAEETSPPVVSMDDRFLERCRKVIDENLDEAELTVTEYAREVGLSRAQLHRKLKAITGLGPREFIRAHRLRQGARLLRGRYGNVTEVAFAVGFKNPSHFARCFRELFGLAPSEYADGPESPEQP